MQEDFALAAAAVLRAKDVVVAAAWTGAGPLPRCFALPAAAAKAILTGADPAVDQAAHAGSAVLLHVVD